MTEIDVVWPPSGPPLPNHWSLDDLRFGEVEADLVRDNGLLFSLIVSASFIESMTFKYTENLCHHLRDNPPAVQWLRERWQWEEMQHGQALRRYAETVWPELDWPAGYRAFYREYLPVSTLEALEQRPGLEMLSRTVVEVGTSTYYTMLGHLSREPVWRHIAARIVQDEVRHYTYFHRFFRSYSGGERFGRGTCTRVIVRRLQIMEHEDAEIALRAIQHALPAGHRFRNEHTADIRRAAVLASEDAYPYRMAVNMLLKPLKLPWPIKRALTPLLEKSARTLLFRGAQSRAPRPTQAGLNSAA